MTETTILFAKVEVGRGVMILVEKTKAHWFLIGVLVDDTGTVVECDWLECGKCEIDNCDVET